jgi:signal transduction histidine kinase
MSQVFDRISRALARIEAAAAHVPAAPSATAGEFAALQARHAELKRETTNALSAIDAVIAQAERTQSQQEGQL